MQDFELASAGETSATLTGTTGQDRSEIRVFAAKRGIDITVSCLLLPFLLVVGLVLLGLNPLFNRGPLMFAQIRMGRGCRAFVALKFRSMTPERSLHRSPYDPVEHHRITALGCLLRRTRLDELPQIINVLRGEMSLIGPRPDCFSHARHYCRRIPGYRARYQVRPGISGLAQIQIGYAQDAQTVAAKTRADIHYINNLDPWLDAAIFWRTLMTVLLLRGV